MKRLAVLIALGALGAGTPSLAAADPPHAEFLKALRNKYGPRLADDYLRRLPAGAGAESDPALALEVARTKLELAAIENSLGERLRLSQEAQAVLDAFFKGKPTDDQRAEAKLVNLQVLNLRGKALLSHAFRQDSPDARRAEAAKARPALTEVGNQIQLALIQLENDLAKRAEPKTPKEREAKKALEDAKLQTELELAVNLYDQAETYAGLQRLEQIGNAQAKFERLEKADFNNPVRWQAKAWAGRCLQERDKQKEAAVKFAEVDNPTGAYAEAGQRLAGYFRLLSLQSLMDRQKGPELKKTLDEIQKQAEKWRRAYATHLNTPEGYAVRFLLAESYRKEAETADKITEDQKKKLYDEAKKLYREVELRDNDYAARAKERKFRVLKAALGGEERIAAAKIDGLGSFDELYVRAQVEASRFADDVKEAKGDAKQLEKRRQERFGRIIEALNRGLELAPKANPPVPEDDLNEGRLMLAYAHLAGGNPKEAARLGEELARGKASVPQAPTAGVYALQAYRQVLSSPEAAKVEKAELEGYRARLRELADYLVKTWPEDQAADNAKHQLAYLLLEEKKWPEAIVLLDAVRPTYSGGVLAKYQLALAAFAADKEQAKPAASDKDKRPWKDRAMDALRNLPPLPPGADAATCQVYVEGKLQLAMILYKAQDYEEIDRLARPLIDGLTAGTIALEPEAKQRLYPSVLSLVLYAAYGRAEPRYAKNEFAEAGKLFDPVLALLRNQAHLDELKKNPELCQAILGMALRADVQSGRNPQALEVVKLLTKLGAGQSDTTLAILESVVTQLGGQVQELRAAGSKEQLDKQVKLYTAFLDEIAKQQGLGPELLGFLGESYAGVDNHAKAAEFLKRVPEPKGQGDQPPDPKQLEFFFHCRSLHLRELRLDNKLDQAEKALEEVKKVTGAAASEELQVEELHLLDARGKHKEAYPKWNALVNSLAGKINTKPRLRELYFEAYYGLVSSYYAFGKTQEDAKREEITKKAAGFIVKLEKTWPEKGGKAFEARYNQLFEKEPALKEQYEKQKSSK